MIFCVKGDCMKINRVKLSCRTDVPVVGESDLDHTLILFRSPVIIPTNGKKQKYRGSCAILYNSGSARSFSPAGDNPLHYDMISFRPSAAERSYIASMNIPLDTPIRLSDDYIAATAMRSIKSQSARRSKNSVEFAELSMRLIFISLSDECNPTEVSPSETIPHYTQLKNIRNAIYNDPVNCGSAEELSDSLGISRAYFHRLYLKAFGVTCRQDIIRSRLLFASELLESTDMSVSSIAERCGYESDSYFMRQFRKHKGCTPTEFRRRKHSEQL